MAGFIRTDWCLLYIMVFFLTSIKIPFLLTLHLFLKCVFSPQISVFSILVHDTGPEVENSEPPTKVTYTMLELS